jgi:hypothetical protein
VVVHDAQRLLEPLSQLRIQRHVASVRSVLIAAVRMEFTGVARKFGAVPKSKIARHALDGALAFPPPVGLVSSMFAWEGNRRSGTPAK